MSDEQRWAIDRSAISSSVSLRQACARAGLDRGGRRCPDCPLRDLCQSELRWLVKSVAEECYRC
jgi:hypothetical protein